MNDDAVAGKVACQIRIGIAEVAASVPGDIDLDVLDRLPPHVVRLELRAGDGEVVGEGARPLVDVGLLQALLRLGLDGVAHLLRLGLKREPQLALVEKELVHAVEDTDGDGGSRARARENLA
jgi:hypothetical protein